MTASTRQVEEPGRRRRDPFAGTFVDEVTRREPARREPVRPEPARPEPGRPEPTRVGRLPDHEGLLAPERSSEGSPRRAPLTATLGPATTETADRRRILADLASRDGIRRALLLQEILGPPRALRPLDDPLAP